jgi:hypothetical protein
MLGAGAFSVKRVPLWIIFTCSWLIARLGDGRGEVGGEGFSKIALESASLSIESLRASCSALCGSGENYNFQGLRLLPVQLLVQQAFGHLVEHYYSSFVLLVGIVVVDL